MVVGDERGAQREPGVAALPLILLPAFGPLTPPLPPPLVLRQV